MNSVIAIVLGGGKGTRLYPLTKVRSKPAVPFGGKYRLVDIPISNCIVAGFKKIFILTQFNSVSLHQHLSNTYLFDTFSEGFVEILAAQQSFDKAGWYEGTADAVRKNFSHFHDRKPSHYIILSGDQLYSMDLKDMFDKHLESKAQVTIAAHPVSRSEASELGILATDDRSRINKFLEKPGPDKNIDEYKIPEKLRKFIRKDYSDREYLGSMGMYIFNADVLDRALDNNYTDFGKEVIPAIIEKTHVNCYLYDGYWEDIGTIKSFYDANLQLASVNPEFNFYDETRPIYTHRRDLPATKINFCTISQSLTAEGSIITNASIINSIIGIRTVIESGASLDGVITLGAKFYETEEEKRQNLKNGIPNVGIGRGAIIRNAIIDQNARIGDGCRIGIDDGIVRNDGDYGFYNIQSGIIVIIKDAIVPHGTII